MNTRKVLIASPSLLHRNRVASLVGGLQGFAVCALASDLSETFNSAEIHAPDLVIIAEDFTRLEEFSVMKALFAALGAGWVLFGAGPQSPARPTSGSGAPPFLDLTLPADAASRLLRSVASAPRLPLAEATRPVAATPAPAAAPGGSAFDKVVLIGSSTGGVDALITLLSAFPADCPPTAIVQHTGRGFSESLVQLLRRRCKARVLAAQDGVALQQGTVCLAGGVDGHLTLVPGAPPHCQVRPGPPVSGHLPSIDMLFRSAVPLASRVVGVILTGMGQDGAAGLLELRRAGSLTIGQDEATSVVYGMPKAAWDRGAVQIQLPIQRIGEEILRCAAPSTLQSDRRLVAR